MKNTTPFVIDVSASGAVGSAVRTTLNGDAAGVAIAGLDSSPYTLPPSYQVTVMVGSGGATFSLSGSSYNTKYAKLKALEGFIPGKAFTDWQAISGFVDELSSDASEYAQCKQGANFIELAACAAEFTWNVNFAIDRFAVSVGIELTKASVSYLLNLLNTALWANGAVSSLNDLRKAPLSFSIAAATAPSSSGKSGSSASSSGTSGGTKPNGARPTVSLAQGPAAPYGYRYAVTLYGYSPGTAVSVECYDSTDPGGFYNFTLTTNSSGVAFTQRECYSGGGPDHWVTAGGLQSNHVEWGDGSQSPPPTTAPPTTSPPTTTTPTWTEQEGHHGADTFSNPYNASGQGPSISPGAYVDVSCKIYAPQISSANPDGYWYRVSSSPWNDAYYAVANTFMNGDTWGCWTTNTCTHNTDFAVRNC